MERLDTSGDAPGWIFDHRARREGRAAIRISGGTIVATTSAGQEVQSASGGEFVLDLDALRWRREA